MQEMGFPEESLYVWNYLTKNVVLRRVTDARQRKLNFPAAYLTEEAWALLPGKIGSYALHAKSFGDKKRAGYVDPMIELDKKAMYKAEGFNLSEALCQLAFVLKESKEI